VAARLHHERWSGERELTHAIYGTVVGAAAMATASAHGSLGAVVVTVLVTVAVYWVAERYAEVLAAAVHGPGRRGRVAEALRQGWPTIEAAYAPLVVLVLFVLLTGRLNSGVVAALAVSTAMLSGFGYVAARRAGAARPAALGWAATSATLGVIVILLKTAL
jgi:positive regulator of sigma E activity